MDFKSRISNFQFPISNFKSKLAFTLIEMLTVIVIIGILAGLLLVVANAARKRAYRAQANAEVRELAKAWKSYWMLYEKWPSGYSGEEKMDAAAMQILQGEDPDENPQGIKFMDVGSEALQVGFNDPWGEPYRVDFSMNPVIGVDSNQTTVFFPNRKRFDYE